MSSGALHLYARAPNLPIMPSDCISQPDLFGPHTLPGLRYRDDFLSEEEESNLIRHIDAEDLAPFRFQQWTGKRLTATFGWSYDFETGRFGPTRPLPEFLTPVRERAAQFAGLAASRLEQALLIRYDAGAEIGWHRDRPVFEEVIGISLGSPAPMRFRQRLEKGFRRNTVPLAPRSIYLLSGEARYEWEHSIDALPEARWSITFRTLSEKGRAKSSRPE
ncbi:alpha-ketoglutarate-dependent dioxygenase AlkB [Hyphomicrobium sp. MC1]|uniref:alpha-ketoglutarate-dependent dioxygenase AlkB n=2 Tax=unclassified Hyphomicrobium TaxID=2619925 RepID=UPI00045E8151|nr:alpha-ketoglutarate-dependent dioxygenase AlkB [Hyphomicrobium sp. MC1]